MPLISVILPTRDRGTLLPRAVASVLSQTERDLELIIVDNNRIEPRVEQHASAPAWLADPRVRIIRTPDVHTAAQARNAGQGVARGEWLSYLDDDDAYRPAKLERQLVLAVFTGSPLVICGATFHLRGRVRDVQTEIDGWTGTDLLFRARWNTPLLLHRRVDAYRFSEELSNGEDVELALRILKLAGLGHVPVVPESLVDIHPQYGPRVNTDFIGQWRSARKVLRLYRRDLDRMDRRRYLLQVLLSRAKLRGDLAVAAGLATRLIAVSRGADWRMGANAVLMASGWQRGRWVN